MSRQFHLADLFEITADSVPDRPAIVTDARTFTYRELDQRWGERVVAIVSRRAGADQPALDAVKAFLGDRLAGYKLPRELIWTDEVKRSPAGKQDYRWAKQLALDTLP
jgi:acyl-CoA synthetase (AMP-forming)/AMP-acid ligase II